MREKFILELTKKAFEEFITNNQTVPSFGDGFYDVKEYFDEEKAINYFNELSFEKIKLYILFLAKAYDRGDTPSADDCSCLDFANIIVNTREFIDELVAVYFNQLYYYLSDQIEEFDYLEDEQINVKMQQKIIAEIQKFENKKGR